jgi:hypothetical protein
MLAVEADTVCRNARLASFGECHQHIDQLTVVDWTARQRKIDMHMIGNRGGGGESTNEFRCGIDRMHPFLNIPPIPQGLNPTCCGTGSDSHEEFRVSTDTMDSFRVGCGGD